MADQTNYTASGGSTGIAFIVGILVVAVGILAWAVFGNGDLARNGGVDDVGISVEGADTPVEKAAEAVSN